MPHPNEKVLYRDKEQGVMDDLRLTKGISGFDAAHLIEQDMRMFQSMVYHLVTS